MANFDLMRELHVKNDGKIVLLIMDGLGGLASAPDGKTELEAAETPHLDRLAREGTLGQVVPIARGITPGSGPAHLALFGYDPLFYDVGRGVMEGSGIGMHIGEGDVAARANFCTLDDQGNITDRRAGRIPTEEAIPVVEKLKQIKLPGVKIDVQLVREYRFAVVMRGPDLDPDIEDTDPQKTGVPPRKVTAQSPGAEHTARLFQQWVEAACEALKDEPKANGITLRGFSTDPKLPKFPEIYGLNPACIAVYPMYRGVSKLVGMEILKFEQESPEAEFTVARQHWDDYDFFFIHIKKVDSRGEDGDFDAKAEVIASVDRALPALLELEPAVIAVTGDHSTPSQLRSHSWHPVPFLLWAPGTVRIDAQKVFGETACAQGGLGTLPTTDIMPLLLAHAKRLRKYGA
ncbi:MAG: 2,3-bisphosphoglycerate-independent phosphoglycerate mutase [Anaerolineales bacterium]|nr:2,3-bisphosphoglycerate-independent phosphoglycerate mutase [Anaerolineales bacterium]